MKRPAERLRYSKGREACFSWRKFRRIWLAAAASVVVADSATAQSSEWRIISVNGTPAQGDAGVRVTTDGAMSGGTGCNRFNGTARFEDGALVLDGPLATTRMACPGADLTAQEDTVLRVLQSGAAVAFDPASGIMTLSRASDRLTLSPGAFGDPAIQALPEDSSDDGADLFSAPYASVFGLSGPLNIRSEPNTESKVIARVLAGTLLRNEGCEQGSNRDWCKIKFIDASAREGWAAAEYLQPAPALIRAKEGVFDQIGTLSCASGTATDVNECDYGLARDGGHSVALVIYQLDGETLLATFADGSLSSITKSGQAIAEIDSVLADETLQLTLAGERYKIPTSLVEGRAE